MRININNNLNASDLRILQDHNIGLRLDTNGNIQVLDQWMHDGNFDSKWITPTFKNTKQLLTWLGY